MTTNAQPLQMMLDPKLIDVRKDFNPRIDLGELDRLMDQIKSQKAQDPRSGGLLQNLTVKPKGDRYELVDGERRFTVVKMMMKKGEDFPFGIPVNVKKESQSDIESLIQAFIANESLPLKPIERGNAFLRLKEAGLTIAQIEKRTGVSDNTILDEIALVKSDPALQKAVTDKKITATVAKKIAVNAKGDSKLQKSLTKKAVAAGRNPTKRDALAQDIEKARRAKATKKGRTLKLQPISPVQLQQWGVKAERYLHAKIKEAKIEKIADLRGWVAENNDRAAAYQLGVMEAMKVVAGLRVNLDI